MKYNKSLSSVLLSKNNNKFFSLSLCSSGGSVRCGLGSYTLQDKNYNVFNDGKELVKTVSSMEDVLNILQISDYIVFNHDYEDFMVWFALNKNKIDYLGDFKDILSLYKESLKQCA